MPTRADKSENERDSTQMPMAKKEQTTNACGKEIQTSRQMLVANEKWLP